MGILKKIEKNNCIIAIWDMQESLEELMQQSADISTPDFNNKRKIINLQDRVAIITGSSRGFGARMVELIHHSGGKCAITYLTGDKTEEENAKNLASQLNGSIVFLITFLISFLIVLDIDRELSIATIARLSTLPSDL